MRYSACKRPLLWAVGAAILVAAPAAAQEEPTQPIPTQRFKLDRRDGCFRYIGNAVEFVGRFKAGSYIGVSMITIGGDGMPTPPADEDRTPAMDLPAWSSASPHSWFGPTTSSRDYAITFAPRAFWGSSAIVTICGRQSPPEN
ncbi:hypothetical protein ACFSOZ_11690 [Mesorhizobium newzealandense]|uniref:DUF2155 domain-containing protein n=1 Tax=Mesorhizobium newzealandense TaxID=1300302 RepID=A0ABW4UAS1_9HYPH